MLKGLTVPLQGGAGTQERAELNLAETTSPATHNSSQNDAKEKATPQSPGQAFCVVIRPHTLPVAGFGGLTADSLGPRMLCTILGLRTDMQLANTETLF